MSKPPKEKSFEIEKIHLDRLTRIVLIVMIGLVFSLSTFFHEPLVSIRFYFNLLYTGFLAWSITCFQEFFSNSNGLKKYSGTELVALKRKQNALIGCLIIDVTIILYDLKIFIPQERLLVARGFCLGLYGVTFYSFFKGKFYMKKTQSK